MNLKEKEKRIDEIIHRGIIKQILPSEEEFKKALLERKLKFFHGADPTGPSLHLSHAKNIMLLEEFRQLGHEVFILFGDFTAEYILDSIPLYAGVIVSFIFEEILVARIKK